MATALTYYAQKNTLIFPEEFITSSEKENWISIWKVFELVRDKDYMRNLTIPESNFLYFLEDYLRVKGKPPPLEDCSRELHSRELYIPESVSVVLPKTEKSDFELSMERGRLATEDEREQLTGVSLLRRKIIDLLRSGEDDVFRLDMCLPNHKLGEILEVLDYLAERGEITLFGGDIVLNIPTAPIINHDPRQRRFPETRAG